MRPWRTPQCVHVELPAGDDRFGVVRCRAAAGLADDPRAKRAVLIQMISDAEAAGGRLELGTVHACWHDMTADVVWWVGRTVRRADT